MLKQIVKRGAQIAFAHAVPLAWACRRGVLVVLMYHRVLPEHDQRAMNEQPGMYVRPETFRMHLRVLRQHFTIVRLSEWIARASSGRALPPLACAITFDDGWRDNYEYAYPILREEGATATIFVVSDLIGTEAKFWPERLARLLRFTVRHGHDRAWVLPEWLRELWPSLQDERELPIEAIDSAITLAKARYSDDTMTQLVNEATEIVSMPHAGGISLLDWQQLGEMARSGVMEVGSHTRRHVRMAPELDDQVMRDEILQSKRVIEENVGAPVNMFCYPNGNFTRSAHALVKANYIGACSTRKGWHAPGDDPHLIRRIGVHQDVAPDPAAFLARVSGWL